MRKLSLPAILGSSILGNLFCGVAAFYAVAAYYGWNVRPESYTHSRPAVDEAGHPFVLFGLLLIVGLVFLLPSWIAIYKAFHPQQKQYQSQKQGTENTESFLKAADFYKTFDNPLLTDLEKAVRTESEKYEPGNERERYLVRVIASVIAVAAFEMTYLNIFGSQLRALNDLNKSHAVT